MVEMGHLFLVLEVLSGFMAWAQPKPARQIAQEAFPSVVLVVMQDSQGQPTILGSGFVIGEGQVVTNKHVITGAVNGYVRLVDKEGKYAIAGTLATDDVHDLAVLAVSGLKAPALAVGDSGQIAVGDEVFAIGNPRGLEGTFSQGIISAIRHVGGDTVLQMTAPISPGSSGGPILNNSGKVIGIAVATFTAGQNLNLAIPASCLSALMARIGHDVQSLARQGAATAKHSIIDDLGGPDNQGVIAESFEWGYLGGYTFSLRNQLKETVRDVEYLIIFRDKRGQPVDYVWYISPDAIPALLAKRVLGKSVDPSVPRLTRNVEMRVLDFRFVQ